MTELRHAFLDLTAGPFEWGPVIAGEGVRSKSTIPRVPRQASWIDPTLSGNDGSVEESKKEEESASYDMERYRSELAFMEAFRAQRCGISEQEEEVEQSSYCADMAQHIANIQQAIASLEAQGTPSYTPTFLVGGTHEGANSTHVSDDFMSRLGATVSFCVLFG